MLWHHDQVEFVRRHRLLTVLGALALLLIVLVLLALPLRNVPGDAQAAKAELSKAAESLKAGDDTVAFAHVAAARGHVDDVTAVTDGIGARIWSWIPVAGSAVRDVRDLGAAMDEVTSALEVVEGVYPDVAGDDARLMGDSAVDLDVLAEVTTAAKKIGTHLNSAVGHLDEVTGSAPIVGEQASSARDEAQNLVVPVTDALNRFAPLLDRLPEMLGSDGEKNYVVSMMNPTEIKYSGGTQLTFAVVKMNDGVIKRGKTLDSTNGTLFQKRGWWENVEGNTFASKYSEMMIHANIAPSWPVAAEETLRAWTYFRKTEVDGMLVLDTVALARMLEVTGPLKVKGMEDITAANLVERTGGDYDQFTINQQKERKELNRRMIPAFMDALFSGSDVVGTMRAVGDAADQRHLALYFRDQQLQEAVVDLGVDGDLSQTDHDYLGVFTQNRIGSKADYGQQKSVVSKVALNADGSAKVRMTTHIDNTNTGFRGAELSGYTNPKIEQNVLLMLPHDVKVKSVKVTDSRDTRTFPVKTTEYFGRPYLELQQIYLDAGDRVTVEAVYTVPRAAEVSGDRLTYSLDLDPHATVRDAVTKVSVTMPEGFTAAPTAAQRTAGWAEKKPGVWQWSTDAMSHRTQLKLTGER